MQRHVIIKALFLIFSLIFLLSCQDKKIVIGLIQGSNGNSVEMDSVKAFLLKNQQFDYKTVSLSAIETRQLEGFDILWYHKSDILEIPEKLKQEKVIHFLQEYIQNGGNLILSQDAVKLLYDMQLEDKMPQVQYVQAKDEGYGRKLGLHSYREHPVFKSLHGGAYILNPELDTNIRQVGYFEKDDSLQGKAVAVDWAYINLMENKKLMLEYELGRGKVIAIGAYAEFSMPNFHKPHLEVFMNNVIDYLAKPSRGKKYFWDYAQNQVKEFEIQADKIELTQSEKWPFQNSTLQFKLKPTDDFWDLAGQRMLLMGKESAGIDEIWAHPFMSVRDYSIGFRQKSMDSIQWLNNAIEIQITPHALKRKYIVGCDTLIEIITVSIHNPKAVVHYTYSGKGDLDFFIKFKTRLRMMWPYSEKVTGTIYHSFNQNLNAFVFTDKRHELISIVGSNQKPVNQLCGQYSDFIFKDSKLVAKKTNDFVASAIMQFKWEKEETLDILLSAADEKLEKNVKTYRSLANQPLKIYEQSEQYYANMLKNKLLIESPDADFNRAYQWALVATDRFFVNTPGIGKSLVAGYSTTAKGWDGGHKINGRPGYAWYFGRDGEWSGFAVDDYGDFEKVKAVLQLFIDYQDIDGKIFHELTTSGVVHYDAADASPLFVVLAGHYLKHSGDLEMIRKNWDKIKKALDFCFSTDRDHDHLIDNVMVGHGWVEGGHLYGGKTTIYLASCWAVALNEAAYMAKNLNKEALAVYYKNEADTVQKIIIKTFWNDKTSFFNHSINTDGSFIEDITIMPSIPLYFKQIDDRKADAVLQVLATNNFSSDWGVRIVSKQSERFNPRGYHTGSVWPLYTGWVALAEYKNHRPDNGFVHSLNNLNISKYWAKGYVEEVLNGLTYQPSGVCPHQCWSETMAIQPLIEGMLGFEPDAVGNQLALSPAIPVNWDHLRVSNIRLGSQKLSLEMDRKEKSCNYHFIKSGDEDLILHFAPVLQAGTLIESIYINGRKIDFKQINDKSFSQPLLDFSINSDALIEIKCEPGIGISPFIGNPKPGDISKGIRLISEKLEANNYSIVMEGPVGTSKIISVFPGSFHIIKINGAKLLKTENNRLDFLIEFNGQKNKESTYVQQIVSLELIRK